MNWKEEKCLIPRKDEDIPALMVIGEQCVFPAPAVVVLHGLGGDKSFVLTPEIIEMVNRFVLLGVDIRCHGERKPDPAKSVYDLLRGEVQRGRDPFMGMIEDFPFIYDFLNENELVQKGQIGIMGSSWGALHTVLGMASEKRFYAGGCRCMCADVSYLLNFQDLKNFWNAKEFRDAEPINFVQELAPRPFIFVHSVPDNIRHPLAKSVRLFNKAMPVYEQRGKAEKLQLKIIDEKEDTYQPLREFFTLHLGSGRKG